MSELDPIIKYSMDDTEAKAFKIALIWQDECHENLKGEKFERVAKGRDPRKSNLFKYCYKMAKETAGIVPDKDSRLYVRAQIQILKSIRDGRSHALISPHCLVGENAWRRWKVWKRIHEKVMGRSLTCEELGIRIKETRIIAQLQETYDFLKDREFSPEDLERWTLNGEISPFYAVLSPTFARMVKGDTVDKILYRASVTPEVERFFRERFHHEFG